MNNNFNEKSNSAFIITKPDIKEPILTMAFTNMQPITEIYSVEEALKNGTLFKNIDKPFVGRNTLC
ncbi:MAG: spore coat associated protein CotJA [Clostridia bacterium]|nr:spore coat associated protein CotJA [Clostridia bacterium]